MISAALKKRSASANDEPPNFNTASLPPDHFKLWEKGLYLVGYRPFEFLRSAACPNMCDVGNNGGGHY